MYTRGERWSPVSVSVTTTDPPAACGTYLRQDSKQSLMAVTSICEANTRTGRSGCVPVWAAGWGPVLSLPTALPAVSQVQENQPPTNVYRGVPATAGLVGPGLTGAPFLRGYSWGTLGATWVSDRRKDFLPLLLSHLDSSGHHLRGALSN